MLTGDLKPHRELARPAAFPSRTQVFTVPPRVLIDNKASASHTVIEVNGRDRPGLLFEVTRELTRLSLQISSAKISTYGEKVVDVFYVKNLFGHKVEHPAKLAEIRTTLEAVLAKGNETALAKIRPRARRGGVVRSLPFGEGRDGSYSRRSSKNSLTRAKKPSLSGWVRRFSPSFSNSRSSSCWRLVRLTGVSTIASINMSPRAAERSTVIPFERSRNWCPDCVPAGTVTRVRLPSTVGTSIVPPSAAVVIGIGTRQKMLAPSR